MEMTMSEILVIEQSEKYKGDDWWKWAVWVEGGDETLDQIDFVEWTLHPTFPNPIRKTHDRVHKFRIKTGGWGVFQIRALVQMKDGSQIRLKHYLKLSYPEGTQTTS
jgi:transcription initiation factor IIF auxiliary subunit